MGTVGKVIKYHSTCKETNFLWNDYVKLAFFHEYCSLNHKLNN